MSQEPQSKLDELAREAAAHLLEKWEIGAASQFCDEPPDFERASADEVAAELLPFLMLAAVGALRQPAR